MKKSDLKNGMIVVTRNSNYYVVWNDRLLRSIGHLKLSSFNSDLTNPNSEFDIMRIYSPCENPGNVICLTDLANSELLWERILLIPGNIYVRETVIGKFIFKYIGTSSSDGIIYEYFYSVASERFKYKTDVGIGNVSSSILRPATSEEKELLESKRNEYIKSL